MRQGFTEHAVRFLNNLGLCSLAIFRYRPAMEAFLEARKLAESYGDWEKAGTLSLNISSLYLQLGELTSAAAAADRAMALLGGRPAPKYRPQVLAQIARLKARRGQLDSAIPLFQEAVREADREGDVAFMAHAWNQLGYELLRQGRLREAEGAIVEAFRLRRLNRDRDLEYSYRTLGLLRLKQGDARSARVLLDNAVARTRRGAGRVPVWSAYYLRGQALLAAGDLPGALADFRAGLDLARRWRLEVLPADATRVSSEVELHELHSAFVEAAMRLYAGQRTAPAARAALLAEAFAVAEENRAASLLALILDRDWLSRAPAEYAETLARLRAADAALLGDDPPAQRERNRLQAALTEMETKFGLDFGAGRAADAARFSQEVMRALRPDECLLSFHLGEAESYLWTLARAGIQVHQLPGRQRIAGRVRELVAAITARSATAAEVGRTLYAELFGGLSPGALAKPRWLLTLDGTLFQLPFAALVADSGPGGPAFLIERHSVQVIPSAHVLLSRPAEDAAPAPGRFVGVGDAIYNSADPRWRPAGLARPPKAALQLPRLAASGRELRACAAAWDPMSRPVLLEGAAASAEQLAATMQRGCPVLHIAAHVVPSAAADLPQGLIALSMQPAGGPELLGAAEIARWRAKLGLVVLSGCSSGLAGSLPGAGLMGLTRAWLAAGARSVTASLWTTPDDTGELFLAFYRHYRSLAGTGAATALQRAQLDMVRSGNWRSHPSYWAAYFLLGKG